MSQLLPNQRLLHIHIPRTGGTWINEAFRILNVHVSMKFQRKKCSNTRKLVAKHCLLSHYAAKEFAKWDTSFAFVRHPIAYYESVWGWLKESGKYKAKVGRFCWHPFMEAYLNFDADFNIWAGRMLETHPGWVSHLFDMYVGPEGGEFVDYIGRTESLLKNFCEIMADFGLSDDRIFDLEKQNVSRYKRVWDESLKLAVMKSENSAISRFYGDNFNRLHYVESSIKIRDMLHV